MFSMICASFHKEQAGYIKSKTAVTSSNIVVQHLSYGQRFFNATLAIHPTQNVGHTSSNVGAKRSHIVEPANVAQKC